MVKSELAKEVYLAHSNNYTVGREGHKICKITPHMMAGVLSAKQCCVNVFQKPNRKASANYCIGNDGDIALCVSEENRAWTSSNRENDFQAITIEVSNCENGGQWRVSDKAWNSLIELCVDICKRYNFRLNYDGTPNGSLTRHNMFANTDCPGKYLQGKFGELANIVNSRLDGTTTQVQEPINNNTGQVDGTIANIQSTLNARYCLNIAVDNIYGKETKKALIIGLQTELNKQYNKGLVVDGIFGINTKNACVSVKKGAQGNITYILQSILVCKGYNTNGVDGIFGSGTESAVKQFQTNNGLIVDGIAGKNTFEKLFL